MSELNKYYNSILEKVDNYFKENNFDKAIDMLVDELDAPYIPEEYYKLFEEKLIEAKYKYNYDNPKNPLINLSKYELMEKIKSNMIGSDVAVVSYFQRFYDEFDLADFEFIKNIFSNKEINNNIKICMVECLKVRLKNLEINYVNKETNFSEILNIDDIVTIDANNEMNKIAESIEELTSSEPSLIDLCFSCIYTIYEHYFPIFPLSEKDPNEIAKKIIYVIKCILENKTPEEDEVTKIIFDTLKKY